LSGDFALFGDFLAGDRFPRCGDLGFTGTLDLATVGFGRVLLSVAFGTRDGLVVVATRGTTVDGTVRGAGTTDVLTVGTTAVFGVTVFEVATVVLDGIVRIPALTLVAVGLESPACSGFGTGGFTTGFGRGGFTAGFEVGATVFVGWSDCLGFASTTG